VAEQHGVVQPGLGEPVAVTAWDVGDQAVDTEPSQVVAHQPGGDRVCAEKVGEQAA